MIFLATCHLAVPSLVPKGSVTRLVWCFIQEYIPTTPTPLPARPITSTSLTSSLPLDPVLVAISELLPKIQDTQRPSSGPSSKIFNLLKDNTTFESLLESLPPSPGLQTRRFQWSTQSSIWLTSLLWGDIYVAGLTSVGVWRDTTVRLFGVKQAIDKGRGAQVGRVLRRFGVV